MELVIGWSSLSFNEQSELPKLPLKLTPLKPHGELIGVPNKLWQGLICHLDLQALSRVASLAAVCLPPDSCQIGTVVEPGAMTVVWEWRRLGPCWW